MFCNGCHFEAEDDDSPDRVVVDIPPHCVRLDTDCHLTPDLFPLIRAMVAGDVEIIPKGKEALFDDDGDYDEECFLIAIRQPKEGGNE